MFKKIVSNLPFSPALIGQLGFYARRLRKEEVTRRLGLVFTVFALVIQTFAAINPPEALATASGQNVIFQGVSSKDQLLGVYDANADAAGHRDIQQIYGQFGVTRQDIVNAQSGSFNSRQFNLGMWSVGRNSYDAGTEYEKAIAINGTGTTVFARKLWRFDSQSYTIRNGSTYNGLVGQRASDGQWFSISFDCGNIAFTSFYTPPAPAAACTNLTVTQLSRTSFRFNGSASVSNGASITSYDYYVFTPANAVVTGQRVSGDGLESSTIMDLSNQPTGNYIARVYVLTTVGTQASSACEKPFSINAAPAATCDSLSVIATSRNDFRLIGKANVVNGASVTRYDFSVNNKAGKTVFVKQVNGDGLASEVAVNLPSEGSYTAFLTIQTSVGAKTGPQCQKAITVTPTPVASCSALSLSTVSRTSFRLSAKAAVSGGATVSKYTFSVLDKSGKVVATKTVASPSTEADTTVDVAKDGDYTAKVVVATSLGDKTSTACQKALKVVPEDRCILNPAYPKSSPECKACLGNPSIWYKDKEQCKPIFEASKTVANMTSNTVDANNTTAKSGDRLSYTLTAKNVGNTSGDYTMTENISDALEYADLLDASGGVYNKDTGALNWAPVTLATGQTVSKTVVVQLKTVIPASPQNVGNPESYNCVMTNTFGTTGHSTTNVKVDCPPTKVVEGVVKQLPATGPGENVLFSGILLVVVTYFFARSRLLNKEVRIVRKHFAAGTL